MPRPAGSAYSGSLSSIPEAEKLLQEARDEYQASLGKAQRVVQYGKLGPKAAFAGGALALSSLALKSISPALAIGAIAVGGAVGIAGGIAWQWAEMEAKELSIVLPHQEQSVHTYEQLVDLVTQRVNQQIQAEQQRLEAERQKSAAAVTEMAQGLHAGNPRKVVLKDKVVVINGIPVPRRSS